MTATDDTALTEQIARALCDNNGDDPDDMELYWDDARIILPIIRKAQADAWDEGFDVGESNGYAIGRDTDAWENNIDNPYREAR